MQQEKYLLKYKNINFYLLKFLTKLLIEIFIILNN